MSRDELAKEMQAIRFLHGMPLKDIQALAEFGSVHEFPAGGVIFREGETVQSVFFLISGNVGLDICAPGVGCRRICTLSSGDLLAWSPLLELSMLTATARSLTPTRLVAVEAEPLVKLCESDTRLGFELMRRTAIALAKRLSATRLQLVDVYGHHMPQLGEVHLASGGDI